MIRVLALVVVCGIGASLTHLGDLPRGGTLMNQNQSSQLEAVMGEVR
jgi:hypothetical protein